MNFFSIAAIPAKLAEISPDLNASVPAWAWLAFAGFIITMLVLDLGVFHRSDKAVPFRDAVVWSIVWVALAGVACALVGLWHGGQVAELFAAGYLLELSLSVDNLFVFLLIFSFFKVPEKYMHRVLFWGIIGAVLFRALFIFGGIALVSKFSWIMYIFGVFLVWTGAKMFLPEKKERDLSDNKIVKIASRLGRFSKELHGHSFFFAKNGLLYATPLFLVLLVIELSDIIFAVDSVPAILGIIPKEAAPGMKMFLAFTSNIFAVLGLRSFFFALSGFMKMLRFLRYGLGAILSFIGAKLILAECGIWHPSTTVSLSVLVVIILISVAFSVAFPAKKSPAEPEKTAEEEPLPPANGEISANDCEDEIPAGTPWIGVDLDGTLAKYDRWRGFDHVGEPVPVMLARVKFWLEKGYTVKIFTARASVPEKGIPPVKKWLADNGLPELEITNQKDFSMIELWDDRAIQVVSDTGRPFLSQSAVGRPAAPILPNEAGNETFYLLKKSFTPKNSGNVKNQNR